MRWHFATRVLLLFPTLQAIAQTTAGFYGASNGDKACKQTYKDFLTCALSVDISIDPLYESISFSDPSACDAYYTSQLQACYGGFWALYSTGDLGTNSPPAVLAGGISKTGNAYAYYSLPTYDTYNAKGVYPARKLDCDACDGFFKRLLQCALPFDSTKKSLTDALQQCAGITKDQDDNFVFTNVEDFFLASTCGLLNGEYSYAPLESDASGRVTYALVTPVFSSVISQYCPTVEAHLKAGGSAQINVLKAGVMFNGANEVVNG